MAKQTPEGAVLRQVLDYLAAKGIFSLRMNSGMVKAEYKGKSRIVRYGVPGMADVLAFPWDMINVGAGCIETITPTWIEVKALSGKQSALQKSFQEKVESEGHRYILVRDCTDLEGIL